MKPKCQNSSNEYLMLVASIRSVFDSLQEPHAPRKIIVTVYTTQDQIRTFLWSDFGNAVHVEKVQPSNRSRDIDASTFTAIGHECVVAIPDLLTAGYSVLYLDNDTLIIPGIWASLTKQQRPKCYTHETWQTMASWLERINKLESVLEMFPVVVKYMSNQIINNGVQFYPQKSHLSRDIALRTRDLYHQLDSRCGYSYGFDQVAYSLAVYELLPNIASFYTIDTGCEDVWHAYQSKRNYCSNLKFIGLVFIPDVGSNIKQVVGIYDKLLQDSIETGVMRSYNTVCGGK